MDQTAMIAGKDEKKVKRKSMSFVSRSSAIGQAGADWVSIGRHRPRQSDRVCRGKVMQSQRNRARTPESSERAGAPVLGLLEALQPTSHALFAVASTFSSIADRSNWIDQLEDVPIMRNQPAAPSRHPRRGSPVDGREGVRAGADVVRSQNALERRPCLFAGIAAPCRRQALATSLCEGDVCSRPQPGHRVCGDFR